MILAVYEASAPLRVPVIILFLVFTLDPAESLQSPAGGFSALKGRLLEQRLLCRWWLWRVRPVMVIT